MSCNVVVDAQACGQAPAAQWKTACIAASRFFAHAAR